MSEEKHPVLRIEALAHDGRGIAFLPGNGRGKIVFAANALPGETIVARLDRDAGNFLEASALRVLDYGPNSEKAPCPHADICGGCDLGRMPYPAQLYWKEQLVKQSLARPGGMTESEIDAIWRPMVPSPEITNFRNKLTLAFGYDSEGKMALGFRKRASHEVFSLEDCALANCAGIVRHVEKAARASGLPPYAGNSGFWKNLVLRRGGNRDQAWIALLVTARTQPHEKRIVERICRELLETEPNCRTLVHEEAGSQRKRLLCLARDGMDKTGAAELDFMLGGRAFSVDAGSFFQVNTLAAEKLANLALSMNREFPNRGGLLDLYCGSGAPGLLLGERYANALGIELDGTAIKSARKNAGAEGKWTFLHGDAAAMLRKREARKKWGAALLDPPRAGLAPAVTDWISEQGPENIIYISCNPATFGRDLKKLSASHRLRSIGVVDMFPHTPHVECCARLEKKT